MNPYCHKAALAILMTVVFIAASSCDRGSEDGAGTPTIVSPPTASLGAGAAPTVPNPVPSSTPSPARVTLARIHRRRTSGQCPEAARRCSCESGIMVLKQQTDPRTRSTQ